LGKDDSARVAALLKCRQGIWDVIDERIVVGVDVADGTLDLAFRVQAQQMKEVDHEDHRDGTCRSAVIRSIFTVSESLLAGSLHVIYMPSHIQLP
jgi:hypothetical protein